MSSISVASFEEMYDAHVDLRFRIRKPQTKIVRIEEEEGSSPESSEDLVGQPGTMMCPKMLRAGLEDLQCKAGVEDLQYTHQVDPDGHLQYKHQVEDGQEQPGEAEERGNDDAPTMHTMNATKQRPVAIISGGTRGIGSGIAHALADDGFDLLLAYKSNKYAADAFVAALKAKHREIQCELVAGDLSKPAARDAMFDCYDEQFGPCRTLGAAIHNAAQYASTPVDSVCPMSVAFDQMHFYQSMYGDGYIDICERSLARMTAERGGALIGISDPRHGADADYAIPGSGKSIMEYSNRIIAVTAGAKNVNSNVIVPGATFSKAQGKAAEKKKGCRAADMGVPGFVALEMWLPFCAVTKDATSQVSACQLMVVCA